MLNEKKKINYCDMFDIVLPIKVIHQRRIKWYLWRLGWIKCQMSKKKKSDSEKREREEILKKLLY